jgi:hypothetical protein
MDWIGKRDVAPEEPPGFEHANRFRASFERIPEVFEDAVATDRVERFVAKWKKMCVGDDICILVGLNIQIDTAIILHNSPLS